MDAPGYGFTKVNVNIKRKWSQMLYDYMKISTRLVRIYVLINIEHGLKNADLQLLDKI